MPEQNQERKSKITASRKLMLKSLLLARAKEALEQEIIDKEEEKKRYLTERVPPQITGGLSFRELQVSNPEPSQINFFSSNTMLAFLY
ncbi:troponin I, slow skeletal muscle-like [Acipenser oxyrinchus oxyrinchus]|uniref:Troponin I, slow skeletal muscle-like n=1 Tax=Acipenser oxyrinchus oxyrinchus TaxID=40147 RepID=A0AAD8CEM3_ACIOX|nr:troponin I, slow skeletal muscle-like [Acipenser oxyrinchus oxyrinchus]